MVSSAGFFLCMQYISWRSVRGMDFEHRSFKQLWKYVDFAFFAPPMPGGRTWPGRALLFGCILVTLALIRIWRRSAGSGRTTNALAWATALTWTPVLKVYVPTDDSILIARSVIATAGVLAGQPGALCPNLVRIERRLQMGKERMHGANPGE